MATGSEHSRGITEQRSLPGRRQTLTLTNHQQVRPVDLRLLRRIMRRLLREAWPDGAFDLAVHVLAGPEMTRLNETFLRHKGLTDIITFDYSDRVGQASRLSPAPLFGAPQSGRRAACPTLLHGELFVCIDEAVSQARRFHTIWQSELVRYVAHGLLHLLGYDDATSRARRRMKAAEDSLVRRLAREFSFRRLSPRG
jgi:rRNA maturation RNase YbeY